MSSASEPVPVPLGETRGFWILMGYALLLGVVGAVAGLVFLGVTGAGNNWYDVSDPGWFGGQWWWVAVTAGAGVVVGLLRSLTKLPAKIPGLIADIEGAHVDTGLVPGIVAVSAVSLIGGASLGPEQALGAMGGGAATWMARRKGLDKEDGDANVLNGFAGAYGGLFSSTTIVVMLILEVARPGGQKFAKALVGGIIASSVSFGIYFVIVGAVFLDAYAGAVVQVRRLATTGRDSVGPARRGRRDSVGRDDRGVDPLVQSVADSQHRDVDVGRRSVRLYRSRVAADPVHR